MTHSTQILCPVCGCGSTTEIKDYSKGLRFAAVRMYHDRKCQQCEAIWTPLTPRWAAWVCIFCGTVLLGGFLLAAYYFLSPYINEKIFDGENRARIAVTDTITSIITPLFLLLTIPGAGFIFHGIRSLSTTQDPEVRKTTTGSVHRS